MGDMVLPPRGGLPAPAPKRSAALNRIRQAKPPTSQPTSADMRRAALDSGRPRLLLAVDATASREAAWNTAREVTDTLFKAIPDALDVGLSVHGGGQVHTWTEFSADPTPLRRKAAGIRCMAGQTRLVAMLDRARAVERLKVVAYVGDVFEESLPQAVTAATALRLKGSRVVILHDTADPLAGTSAADFHAIADASGGCVLPFDACSPAKLRELLEALAVLAVGGVKLLREKRKALPGAIMLLGHLGEG